MVALNASHFLLAVVFPYSPLLPVSTGPKCLSIGKVMVWLSLSVCEGMARGGIEGSMLEREALQLKGDPEVVTVWFFFLWSLYIHSVRK